MLERYFGESGDQDDLSAMVKKYAAARQSYDGGMAYAVRAVALRHEPVQEGSGSYLAGCEFQVAQKCLRLIKVYAISFMP
jgi:hypothetical protein